jgi:microcystin degradation protein MlrC
MPASTVFPWRHRPPDLEHPPMRLVLAEMMHDGRYRVSCPMMTGVDLDHGAPAVLEIGRAQILVCSKRMEPTARRYLLIKTRQHFRAGFAPIAKHLVLLSGPGVTSSDYGLFRWTRVPRPLYPLDPDMARPGASRWLSSGCEVPPGQVKA